MTYRRHRQPIRRRLCFLLATALLATTAVAHEPDGAAARSHVDTHRSAALTEDGARSAPPMARQFMRGMADDLGLTAEQRDAVRDLMERERPRMQALREEQFANRQRLMDASPDDVAYDSVVQEVAETNGRLTAERIRRGGQLRAEVHALLTPDQRVKAREVREQLRTRMEHRMFHGPEFPF